jgi:hypothetical protein
MRDVVERVNGEDAEQQPIRGDARDEAEDADRHVDDAEREDDPLDRHGHIALRELV